MIRLSFYRRLFTAAMAATVAIDKISAVWVHSLIDFNDDIDENLVLPQALSQVDLASNNMSEASTTVESNLMSQAQSKLNGTNESTSTVDAINEAIAELEGSKKKKSKKRIAK